MATEALESILPSQCSFLHAFDSTASKINHRDGIFRLTRSTGEMHGFMPLRLCSSASSSSSSSCFSPSSYKVSRSDGAKEKWELHASTSTSSASSSPSAFKLAQNHGNYKIQEKRELVKACEKFRTAGIGHFRSCRVVASSFSSSSSSPSTSASSASSQSDESQSASPSPIPVSKRTPPLFVLNDKPDRALQKPARVLERWRPKRDFADSFEDDEGFSLTTPDSNHQSGYVALIGKPNVGKSTLLNCIVGQKLSIVTHKPQTTRHRILGICSAPNYQMILYDTPGIITKRMNKLDEMMMQNVRTAALNADCVLVIIDASEAPQKVTDSLEEGALKIVQSRPSLLVLNKIDLIKPGEVDKKRQWYAEFSGLTEVLDVSAKYGHGATELKSWLVSKLPLGPAYYPKEDLSDQPEKFFASEIIREKIFLQYKKEIPYVCQVNVIKYVERTPPAKDFIEVDIVVERETQKAILIGKEGSALKTLATAARLDIEDFVGRKVYLEVKVKVKEDWRANESLLKYYGYSSQLSA